MNKRKLGSLHRWLFIFMGLPMLIWLVSGIVMSLPYNWFVGTSNTEQVKLDYKTIVLSPADAISQLEKHTGGSLEVSKIQLKQIDEGFYYHIRAKGNTSGLINGKTGTIFSFTPELAEKLARQNFGIESPLLESIRLTKHTSTYPAGALPVYRLTFQGYEGHLYYVNENNASVSRSTLASRIFGVMVKLHAFKPLESVTGKNLRIGTLFITGILSLIGTIIGVMLIFPLRRKRARTPN